MKLKLIEVNGYYVAVDENAPLKQGDLCIDGYLNISPFADLSSIGLGYDIRTIHKVILADPELNLGLPTIPDWKEFELEQLAIQAADKLSWDFDYSDGCGYNDYVNGFIAGQESKEGLYTLEEAVGFYLWAKANFGYVKQVEEGCIINKTDYNGLFKIYAKTLQKVPTHIEIETIKVWSSFKADRYKIIQPKLITLLNGQQTAVLKEVIYDSK